MMKAFLLALLLAPAALAQPSLYILGDSPAIQGWGVPFAAYFDPSKVTVVNAAKLDRLEEKLKPGDTVLLQLAGDQALRKMVDDVRSKGASPIILTLPVPDHAASMWAMDVARDAKVPVIDVENMSAGRAGVDAALVLAGMKALHRPGFEEWLSWKGRDVPEADPKYIFRNAGRPR